MFKKSLLLTSLLLTACSPAFAAGAPLGGFVVNAQSVAVTEAIGLGGEDIGAVLEVYDGKVVLSKVRLHKEGDSCITGTKAVNMIGGTNVQIRLVKNGSMCYFLPVTDAGRDYVNKLFETEAVVEWGDSTFSTIGYKESIEILKSQRNAI